MISEDRLVQAVVNNGSLPGNLREASAAGLNKLEQYYSLAHNNYCCILATGMIIDMSLVFSNCLASSSMPSINVIEVVSKY